MTPDSLAFLRTLLDSPGPSSFEVVPARAWRAEAARITPDVDVDVNGNSYATIGRGNAPRIMLAGHIDEIGVIVTHIDDAGYLSFDGVGGWDSQVFIGQRVQLLTRHGTIAGVVGKKAIHLMSPDDRKKVSQIDDLWIDIGARTKDEAAALVRVGDPGVLAVSALELPNGRLASRALDNRLGAYVVLEALRLLSQAHTPIAAQVTAVATTREEIAYGGGGARPGAYSLQPHAAIVVDVTHATDYPGIDKRKDGDYALGGGPVIARGAAVSTVVAERLIEAAEAGGIPYRLEASGRDTFTDAEAIFNAHAGVATALVSIPLRYMHSPNELCQLDDVQNAAKLLAAFVSRLTSEMDFVPR
jgi:endoglucanase